MKTPPAGNKLDNLQPVLYSRLTALSCVQLQKTWFGGFLIPPEMAPFYPAATSPTISWQQDLYELGGASIRLADPVGQNLCGM